MKKHSIACLLPRASSNNPYWTLFHHGFEQAQKLLGPESLSIDMVEFDADRKSTLLSAWTDLKYRTFDGLVLAPLHPKHQLDPLKRMDLKDIPYVFIDTQAQVGNPLGFVGQHARASGSVGAELLNMITPPGSDFLVVNLKNVLNDNLINLKSREEGFRHYVSANCPERKVHHIAYAPSGEAHLKKEVERLMTSYPQISGAFMPNSRAYKLARVLNELNHAIKLIGYDPLETNLAALQEGNLHFLLCQHPEQQGFRAILRLYEHLEKNSTSDGDEFMPIDIVSKGNLPYYRASSPLVQP